MTLRVFLREPLLHFLLIGGCFFLLFGWLNRGTLEARDEIVVDQVRIDNLTAQFERVWQRPPTAQEVSALVESWIREEVLYREGMALGLGTDDSVVRRRVAQKMAFIADGMAVEEPSEAELESWLQENASDYRIEAAYSLRQVYFDPTRRADDLRERMAGMLQTLGQASMAPEGDATLLPGRMQSVRASDIARTFGSQFATALADLPVGEWRGPIESSYGLHLVLVQERIPGRLPLLEEARVAVERDWSAAKTEELNEAFYQAVRERYTVRVTADVTAAAANATSSAR